MRAHSTSASAAHIANAPQTPNTGKRLLVEKPLGVTVEECETVRERVREIGLILQVGTMKRLD